MGDLSLKFSVSADQARRAFDAPYDNSLVENLHGVEVSDPFRGMEQIHAPETTAWMQREDAAAAAFVAPAANVEAQALKFMLDAIPHGTRESMPSRYGDQYICWRKAENEERWSLYIKDVPDYGAPARLLLDPMKIDPSGKTNIAGTSFTRDGKTLAYQLSVSGSDETSLHFMDVATGADFGETYPKFRSGIRWDRDGQGFHYSAPVGDKTFEVRYHKMGTQPGDDQVVFNPGQPQMRSGYFRIGHDSTDQPGSLEWISMSGTQPDKNALFARPTGSSEAFREIFPLKEGTLGPIHEVGGKIYATTSLGAPNEKLVAFDPNDPDPSKWQTILPENPNDPMLGAFVWQNKIFATYSHDTGSQIKVFDLQGRYLHDVPVPPLSSASMGSFRMEDTEALLTYDNFQEEGNIYKYDSTTNQMSLYRQSQTPIDLKDCIVERLHATSKDGTQVPMTVIRAPGTKLDGTAATLLYGYGGFGNALEPSFSSSVAEWVRAGGIYVQANLRGGGEYGQAWYDAGRLKNKQNVFDDFAACAQHLIDNNYTSPKRLAIQGGSNGGLLTLATMEQHPDLFGAVVSEVPVADMFRFHIGSYYGYGWKSDYGDPDLKDDFNTQAAYSPLHNVKPGFKHPPLLIKSDTHDDRVQPWHSFKMAATLQCLEDPGSLTLLKMRSDGGHSAGLTEKQWYEDVAFVRGFLHETLGPTDQAEYRASPKWAEHHPQAGPAPSI
ncbi:MAG TPA: prolyl oligopeptidase family serine peptidase [Patescibacteria group bacterium]|nr:prolyl oligopeptidase family serine peptidase [Patescibacteria group bacterium]